MFLFFLSAKNAKVGAVGREVWTRVERGDVQFSARLVRPRPQVKSAQKKGGIHILDVTSRWYDSKLGLDSSRAALTRSSCKKKT